MPSIILDMYKHNQASLDVTKIARKTGRMAKMNVHEKSTASAPAAMMSGVAEVIEGDGVAGDVAGVEDEKW